MNCRIFVPIIAALLLACEGPVGPAGPTGAQGAQGAPGVSGPQGPPGQAGSGTRLWLPGTTDFAGSVNLFLPAAAGTINNPPVMTCYRAARNDDGSPSPQWIVVGGIGTAQTGVGRCGLASQSQNNNPNFPLRAWMDNQPAAWPVGVVIVY